MFNLARRAAADAALLDYSFGLVIADHGEWEATRPGLEFRRTLFFENPDGGDTIIGHYTVTFRSEDSSVVCGAYASINGNEVGGPMILASGPESP